MQKTGNTATKRSLLARIGKWVGIVLLSIIGLIVLLLILIQTSPVQNFARKKIVTFLQNKLHTRVEIAGLNVDFPKMLVLEGVLIEDQTKDTLLAGKQLKVDIDMFKLLKSELQINEINLNQITVKVKRQLPDTVFNYQFIVNAFASPADTTAKTDTTAMKMAIEKIIVDKTRLVYFDVVTGNDVDVYLGHFDTRIKTFDPAHLQYTVPSIMLTGVRGRIKQTKPLEVTAVISDPNPAVANEAPQVINFVNNEFTLKDIDISYSNDVTGMATGIRFRDLTVHPQQIDLKNSVIALKDVKLNGLNGSFTMNSKANTEVVKLTNEKNAEVPVEALPWKFTVGSIELNDNNFIYDDNTQPRLKRGMDYAHLNLKDFTLKGEEFLFHNDSIAANITDGRMNEGSGFILNKFQAKILYTEKGAALNDILVQTPGSEIKRRAVIRYPSLAAIQKEMGLLEMDIDIEDSYLQVKDILTFVPTLATQPAFRNPAATIFVNTRLKGSLNRLNVQTFQFRGLGNTNVDISGVIGNAMDANNATADLNIRKFTTSRDDIMSLMPPGTLPKGISLPETMALSGRLRGGMRRLELNRLQFRDSRNTVIDLSGTIVNVTDPNAIGANLSINRFSINKASILAVTPPGSIPSNITLPETMALSGSLKGGMKNAVANLFLNTTLGSARIRGYVNNVMDSVRARYNATITTTDLNLGTILQQPQNVGRVSANFTVKGTGYTPDAANATITGVITSAEVKQYVYRNFSIDGSIADQHFTANAAIKDPNIHFALQAEGNLGGELPGFSLNANIDSIKTQPLHLTPEPIFYHGNIVANVPQFNLDALNGEFHVVNSILVVNRRRIAMDSMSMIASAANDTQTISLKTDFINAVIHGQYKLQQLGDIMIDAIEPYYAINTTGKPISPDPYDFTVNATITDHQTLRGFVPTLQRFDGMTLNSRFTSSEGWNAAITSPYLLYGTNLIDNLVLKASASGSALNVNANISKVAAGTSVVMYQPSVKAILENNRINFGISLNDNAARTKYRFAGILSQEPDSIYAFSLKPDSLMLNYKTWSISNSNSIRFSSSMVNARNFDLSQGNQHLVVNSLNNSSRNSPLAIDFKNFSIATLSAFIQPDTLLVDGTLNGNVLVKDIMVQPNFTTNLTLNNLAVKNDTIGDVNIRVNNEVENTFATNVTIAGRGNDISLTGNYYLKPQDNSDFDFNLAIRQLPLRTIEAFSMGAIDQSTGNLTGNVAIKGSVKAPDVNGNIDFNKTAFNVVSMGSYYRIDGESIKVDNAGIRLNTFTILDSANNSLVIDGLAGTRNFTNYDLALTVKALNFRAINTTKRQNSMYYGQLFFNCNLNISGTETSPVVDGSLRINDNTNLSIVLPQSEPGIIDRKGVIEFVDMDAPGTDSIFQYTLARYDSAFNKASIVGYDVSVNIEVVKEANFNVIIDEANGDFLNLQGQALLTGGIDPSGKITMTGTYEIEKGGYELSFNFLRRKFEIQKGSKITWTGEPTTATLDVTAIYIANTSPIDLVQDQVDQTRKNYYQQKLPFQVRLTLRGELMQPTLTFDIVLPTENNVRVSNDILTTVNTRLEQLRAEPSELNKQVFALLLLNRFVSENPFESSGGGGGFNAGSFARQSVSKILTEQLNKLAGDLIAGVDISFDVSSEDDYTTGERRDRTNFNVNLSKRLLNDRLKVSVGSNYELEGPQQSKQTASNVIGNVSVDYSLSRDGRYLLRGYRKNDYDAVVEGYVIETGLKFIISVDYNKFKEIFRKRRQRQNPQQQNSNTSNPIKETTNNAPADQQAVLFTDTLLADDKKLFSALVKDSTDGY